MERCRLDFENFQGGTNSRTQSEVRLHADVQQQEIRVLWAGILLSRYFILSASHPSIWRLSDIFLFNFTFFYFKCLICLCRDSFQ